VLPISDSRPQEARASWNACLAGIFRLPVAIGQSLNPANEQDARKIDAQLDVVSESVKLFNFAFPIVGIILLAIELRHAYFLGPWVSWGAILAARRRSCRAGHRRASARQAPPPYHLSRSSTAGLAVLTDLLGPPYNTAP